MPINSCFRSKDGQILYLNNGGSMLHRITDQNQHTVIEELWHVQVVGSCRHRICSQSMFDYQEQLMRIVNTRSRDNFLELCCSATLTYCPFSLLHTCPAQCTSPSTAGWLVPREAVQKFSQENYLFNMSAKFLLSTPRELQPLRN